MGNWRRSNKWNDVWPYRSVWSLKVCSPRSAALQADFKPRARAQRGTCGVFFSKTSGTIQTFCLSWLLQILKVLWICFKQHNINWVFINSETQNKCGFIYPSMMLPEMVRVVLIFTHTCKYRSKLINSKLWKRSWALICSEARLINKAPFVW